MQIALKDTHFALRNSHTRIPFRYGAVCMTCCPQAILQVELDVDGRSQTGYSGDCLPPGWFDKSPGKSYQQQIDDMLAVTNRSRAIFGDHLAQPSAFFPVWQSVQREVHRYAADRELPSLLAGFGFSLVERAILDAVARYQNVPFHTLIQDNTLDLIPEKIHSELTGFTPQDWIQEKPLTSIYVRHTVGLGDPLTANDVVERPPDPFPVTLEEYLSIAGVRYLKIKLGNQLDRDLERLVTIAELMQQNGNRFQITLDGNEQYTATDQLQELLAAISDSAILRPLLSKTIAIEQPLARSVAFAPEHAAGIRSIGETIVPVIIDESDGELKSCRQAFEVGYRGITSKSCKGAIKAILNAGLVWYHNQQATTKPFVMTGEDLCCVGVVPMQSDLCLAATLGLSHVERNGHHYHPGISYLSQSEQEAALAAHPDLYHQRQGIIAPHVQNGCFEIASLQCPGSGFAAIPDMKSMQAVEEWSFDSLQD